MVNLTVTSIAFVRGEGLSKSEIRKILAEEMPIGKTFLWEDNKFRFDSYIGFHSADGDEIPLDWHTEFTVLSQPMWISTEDSHYSGFYLVVKVFWKVAPGREILGTLKF